MIQDIEPRIFDNSYINTKAESNDYILYYSGNNALINVNGCENIFPAFSDYENIFSEIRGKSTYVFKVDNKRFFLVNGIDLPETDTYKMTEIRDFRTIKPEWQGFCGITGSHLYRWYSTHIYCGRCGAVMQKKSDERAMLCEKCGLVEYPKISPAVIVGITDGDKLLMSRYAHSAYKNYSLIAGFAEIGETLESTVKREVMEEVGVKVKNIRYYKSQPWGLSDSLLAGFFAELDGSAEIKLDTNELSEAQWFARKDIPKSASAISLTSEMIEAFRNKEI